MQRAAWIAAEPSDLCRAVNDVAYSVWLRRKVAATPIVDNVFNVQVRPARAAGAARQALSAVRQERTAALFSRRSVPPDACHAERQHRQGLAEEEREDGIRVSAASGGTRRVAVRYAWPSRDMTVTCGSLFI